MARPVYSKLLTAGSGGNQVFSFALAPVGDTVVIRDMRFVCESDSWTFVPNGFQVYDTGNNFLWEMTCPRARSHFTHTWEGRSVLDADNTLNINVLDLHWSWWVSGYVLTTT